MLSRGPVRIVTPLPFALRSANTWLFPGATPAIVDCGLGTAEAYAALLAGLRDAGVDAGRLCVLATHGHADHVGNAARLKRDAGCRVMAMEEERPHIESFVRDAEVRYGAYGEALRKHGVPPDMVARMRRGGEKFDAWTQDVALDAAFRDGVRVALGDVDATVHAAPGHTPGSMMLTEGNHLVSGDTLLAHITSNAIELIDADAGRFATYLRTLEGLRRFVGCDVLPGHHDPFRLTEAVLDMHLEKHERRANRIRDALDLPRTAWELLPRVLPNMAKDQAFLGVCEMVGHLAALEAQSRVRRIEADGVRRFVMC